MRNFAFLIHPRDVKDTGRRFPGNIVGETWGMKLLPKRLTEWLLPKLRGRFGFTICSRFNVFHKETTGYIIAVLLTGKQMLTLPRKFVRQRILDAILFTQDKLEVEVIGLGALIASVTNGGEWIIRQPGIRAKITHGDSYAIAVAEEGIEKVIDLCGFNWKETKIAIVGAYGMIGKALAKVLAQKGCQLILIGRSRVKLERVKEEIHEIGPNNRVFISLELADIYDADIVITATSHPGALIRADHLRYGAIVYDIAQPMNISPALIKERSDIIKIDGDYVDLNGIQLGFDMGPPLGSTFACCVETIIQALENENGHHVGEIDLRYVEQTRYWAEKYGFAHTPFSCFSRPISVERFQEISQLRRNEKKQNFLTRRP